MPCAPESTVADTMSVRADGRRSLVLRSITSPAGSVSTAGPAAAAGDTKPRHAQQRRDRQGQARRQIESDHLPHTAPPSPRPREEKRVQQHASRRQLRRSFDTARTNSSQMSRSDPNFRRPPVGQ